MKYIESYRSMPTILFHFLYIIHHVFKYRKLHHDGYTLVYKNHKNNGIAGINDKENDGIGVDFSSSLSMMEY